MRIVDQQRGDLVAPRVRRQGIQQQLALLSGVERFHRQPEAGAQVIEDIGEIELGVAEQDEADIVGFRHAAT